MSFTEFYCDTGGDNLNAGSTSATSAAQTYAGGTWASPVFTVASGNPSSDGVAVGDFASIYTTAGATVAILIGRVTARDATTITISTTAISGSTAAPSASAGACTCRVGGAWKGPNGSVSFPFGFVAATMTNSSGDTPRVNFKNNATYQPTAAMTHSLAGPVKFEGYTSSVGDGGRATIDGGSASAYVLLAGTGGSLLFEDLIFTNDAASGTPTHLVNISGNYSTFRRCVFHDCRNAGLSTGTDSLVEECEFYACNKANTASTGASRPSRGTKYVRCIFHDNTGSNTHGIYGNAFVEEVTCIDCVFDTNGADGINSQLAVLTVIGCDFYNNTGSGIQIANTSGGGAATSTAYIENCNFIKNGAYGIRGNSAGEKIGHVVNCGFGSGTAANTSGTTTGLKGIVESGSINYASNVLPWVDAPNGDFRINLAAAKGAGRGTFTQTASSYAGAVGYPDIGSNQHQDAASGTTIAGTPLLRGLAH